MEDQTRNQRLAQVGSLFRNYGTIDLSSASDTVTLPLVEALFKGSPIWEELWSSRTGYAMLDKERIKLIKFAPMGSAVCFPIESMIFASVVRVAQKHVGVHNDFVVYGDDIICHSLVFDEVISLLEKLHFRVNEKKTFYPSSPFKESCGKEYYYGDDVTPFRIPRFFQGWKKPEELKSKPQLLAGWISLANSLFDHSLLRARSYLVSRLLELCPDVPFSRNSDHLALRSYDATNYRLPQRWESDLSSMNRTRKNLCRGRLVKGMTLFTKPSPGDDNIRYQMLLEQYIHTTRQALDVPDDLIQIVAGPSQLKAAPRWLVDAHLMSYPSGYLIKEHDFNHNRTSLKLSSSFELCFDEDGSPEWRMRNL
jgi:hypothetical protein